MARLKRMLSPADDRLTSAADGARRVPRQKRLLATLSAAVQEPIRLQVEGGKGYGRDLRELVSRGYLVMRSHRYRGIHPSTNPSYSDHMLSTAILVLTSKGTAAAERGRL